MQSNLSQHLQSKTSLRALFVAGGIFWIAVVTWFLFYSLERAAFVAADGQISDPTSAQVALAYVSSVLFALPGVGLIVYGIRRRWGPTPTDEQAARR